jgi:soluble lytic murein transglycosylase-like protein
MRSAVLACAIAVSLSLAAHPAHAATVSGFAKNYFAIRDRATKVVTNLDSTEVQSHADHFAGTLVELKGVITAVAGSDAQTNVLIAGTGSDSASNLVALPPDHKLTDWPFLDVGTYVRVLCRVVTVSGGTAGSLELVCPVKEPDAADVDRQRAKEEAARQEKIRKAALARQKPAAPRKLASRGMTGRSYAATAPGNARYSRAQLVEAYASGVRYFNRRIEPDQARSIARAIIDYSLRYGLDARLVMAVIAVESNFNQNAVSRTGAMGLGQLMPGTANDLGVANAFNLDQNLAGSTRLLKSHISTWEANGKVKDEAIKLALACYNAGMGAVQKYKGIPPYRETQDYVRKITRLYHQMRGEPE